MSNGSLIYTPFDDDFNNDEILKIVRNELDLHLYDSHHPVINEICSDTFSRHKIRTFFYREDLLIYIGGDKIFLFSLEEKKLKGYYTPSREFSNKFCDLEIFCSEDPDSQITVITFYDDMYDYGYERSTFFSIFSTNRGEISLHLTSVWHFTFDQKNQALYYLNFAVGGSHGLYRYDLDRVDPIFLCKIVRIDPRQISYTKMFFDTFTERLFIREKPESIKILDKDGIVLQEISLNNLSYSDSGVRRDLLYSFNNFVLISDNRIMVYGKRGHSIVDSEGNIVNKNCAVYRHISYNRKTRMSSLLTHRCVTITDAFQSMDC